jgi:hypothetical protein
MVAIHRGLQSRALGNGEDREATLGQVIGDRKGLFTISGWKCQGVSE